ncbi:MAG: hypothetical protein AAGI38_22740, partial [Bacteroidota bacterium]
MAQGLQAEDKLLIGVNAERLVIELSAFLNRISDPELSQRSRDRLCRESYDVNNPRKLFAGNKVRIEDDINPRNHRSPVGTPPTVSKYLNNFFIFYRAKSSSSIDFSTVKTLDVKQGESYIFAKVFFVSHFKGSYSANNSLEYQPNYRVAEVKAERVAGRWFTIIVNIQFASPEQTAEALADPTSSTLVFQTRQSLENARENLKLLEEIRYDVQTEMIRYRSLEEEDEDFLLTDSLHQELLSMTKNANGEIDKSLQNIEQAREQAQISRKKYLETDSIVTLANQEIRFIQNSASIYDSSLKVINT